MTNAQNNAAKPPEPMKQTDILAIVLYSTYGVLWLILSGIGCLGLMFGAFDRLFLTVNSVIVVAVWLLFVLAPLYLRLIIKRKWVQALVSISMAPLFIVLMLTAMWGATAYFSDFTQAKWADFPDERHLMIDDLKENHGLIGMPADQVIELLGEPGMESENTYTYPCSERDIFTRMYMRITFENGKVGSIEEFLYE